MALSSYSTAKLRSKLSDLSFESPEQERLSPSRNYPTKSLLSKSLAGEKHGGSPNFSSTDSFNEVFPESPTLASDHPEPELLATSVGKDSDGRLIPSSSAISLLSLNNNGNHSNNHHHGAGSQVHSPNPNNYHEPHNSHPHVQHHLHPGMEKKNSFHNIRPVNSFTHLNHLNHQRLQPYHKLLSPAMSQNGDFSNIATPQSIPLARNLSFLQNAPDSPNLIPTSIGGSPSRFWLTSQTPPKSVSGSYKSRQLVLPLTPFTSHTTEPGKFAPSAKGAQSPILNPVQTPSEDMPMTPLYLSSETDLYFVYRKPNNQGYYLSYTESHHRDDGSGEDIAELGPRELHEPDADQLMDD